MGCDTSISQFIKSFQCLLTINSWRQQERYLFHTLTRMNTLLTFYQSKTMAYSGLTVEYTVKTTGDRWFIPVNAPTATTSEQLAQCARTSPDGVEVVAS